MKTAKLVLGMIVLVLAGCGGNGGGSADPAAPAVASLESVDLSGTWEVQRETRNYNKATGDYLYSNLNLSRMMIEDTVNGVLSRSCVNEYRQYFGYSVKTGNMLYLNLNEDGFQYLGDGRFQRVGPKQGSQGYDDNQLHQDVTTLRRISDVEKQDGGSFQLIEPFVVSEDGKVCVTVDSSSIGIDEGVAIAVPYNGYIVTFRLDIDKSIVPGTYNWDDSGRNNTSVFRAYFDADSDLLQSTTGYYSLFPKSGTVTITENSDQYLSSSFDLLDENGVAIKGNFVWDKNW